MCRKGWVAGVFLLAVNGLAQEGWARRPVAADTNAWLAVRTLVAAEEARLTLRHEGGANGNGFALPRYTPSRREISVEADISLRRRLGKAGWNFAGVTLYQDSQNYWMLALVEGPEGTRSVDFIECLEGVWQAQNEAPTALKREGNASFVWESGAAYRLRLAFRDGKVCAEVSEPVSGRVLSSACYGWGAVSAVRCGRPGLIVHASVAECARFSFGLPETALGGRSLPQVALLDDALPGHDQAANARLAEALVKKGLGVTRLTAEQLVAPDAVTAERFSVLVLPQCASVPAQTGPLVQKFAGEGGHVVFLGGPFLDDALWRVGGSWLDPAGRNALLNRVEPARRPFVIGPGLDLGAWRRACSDRAASADFRLVNEGPQNTPCLRLDIGNLQGWEVRHSPEVPHLFGEEHDFFTFLAKSGEETAQLAVEIVERDGSRWIATAELTNGWRRIGLGLENFRFWPDSSAEGKRGGSGDRLEPRHAVRVCFGMSASHTPAMIGGGHTVWLSDVGTARDPLAAAGATQSGMRGSIETVYPRYKVHTVTGMLAVAGTEVRCSKAVCAIPRTLGEGFGRNGKWRFMPLAEARRPGVGTGGVCEWMLLDNRLPGDGVSVAGFGYTDPAVWSAPDVLTRIAAAAARLARGAMLEEAGAEHFAYWPGEPVRLGARIRMFGLQAADLEVAFEIGRAGRVVWSKRVKRRMEAGAADCALEWQPPPEPCEYAVRVHVKDGCGLSDEIEHQFAVLDPAPASARAFVTARDGDFWVGGKQWYPVGVNFWPLYVSGMDVADYWAGWLRDAYYAPALVERDLVQLEGLGVNLVSIQTPPQADHRNLLDFLRRCAKHGIRANLYVGQASPLAFDERSLKEYLESAKLAGNSAVFAYDTIWEPGNHVFKDDAARAKWDAEWRAWIGERYGSLENAETNWRFKARRGKDGLAVSPPDAYFREDGPWRGMMAAYRRFMDNLTSRYWGKAHRRLRELDPNHLVSFRQGNTLPHDFALSGPVKHIDFICPEGYAIRDTDEGEDAIGFITRYVDFTTGGKPVVWSEFGQSVWDSGCMAPNPQSVAKQGRYSERFYRTALAAGADGTVPWWWVGGYRVEERSDFGIVEPDRTERPAARLIREYGPRLKAPRGKVRPEVWFEFDRDAHAGGYWRAAFNEGAKAYRAAAKGGKTLGVRTAGTGTDSATVPLVAVGNVPCDGRNPPKHLDAEFNFLQVRNAEGVWLEAEDGAVITVKAGEPVLARASVGNTQEAAWLARGEQSVLLAVRAIAAVEGQRLGAALLPSQDRGASAGVPYLGDADFGEFDLFAGTRRPVALPVTLSVRMELQGRGPTVPFGEERAFTLRAP